MNKQQRNLTEEEDNSTRVQQIRFASQRSASRSRKSQNPNQTNGNNNNGVWLVTSSKN